MSHASEDRPIVLLSKAAQRRDCELGYLKKYCRIEELSDNPKVLKPKPDAETSGPEKALAFRIASILSMDYFLEAHVRFGTISHGLPILLTRKTAPVEIVIDPSGPTSG